ncbi:uncharacterized protein Z518_01946 [Rhinocladiella mackenziei CBS 650.93]|uniref:DUF7727 domain-containing protein n=1 Tax=Rhinocladiella mackenziei CBS 650.93 TaxID=1442369 RepID=A0A0D2H9X4_9EURO|nr:uncharacterized protein Z518_01946 [Rhinocladiella mackenziei CBS 650.93]KIX07293.1 hypothetical protein Z518_01946 [Rhinocladiella mackenziei CBS 650.93]
MGKLIKNHWARLIVLTAAVYQILASLEGFFWPKIFWDFLTKNLDGAVKPFPVLQIINLILGMLSFAWEWPLHPVVKMLPGLHRSFEARLVVYPLCALAGVMMYQATNAALYYIIGVVVYFWAYSEGEVRPPPFSVLADLADVMLPDSMSRTVDCSEEGWCQTRPSMREPRYAGKRRFM